MDPAGPGVDHLGQGIHIGILELGQGAVFQDQARQFMVCCQGVEHLVIGGIAGLGLLDRRQAQLVKHDLAQLLGRIDVELAPRHGMDGSLQVIDADPDLAADLGQHLFIKRDAGGLHGGQHLHQRQLQLGIERQGFAVGQLFFKDQAQFVQGAGMRRQEGPGLLLGDGRQRARPSAGAGQVLDRGDAAAQMLHGQVFQADRAHGRIRAVGRQHDIEKTRLDRALVFEGRQFDGLGVMHGQIQRG